jgi:hypothetical protein
VLACANPEVAVRATRLLVPAAAVALGAACSDLTIAPTEQDAPVAVDSDVAAPLETDRPKKPRRPRDTDVPPVESDSPIDEPPPVDSAPPGPIDPPVADAGNDRSVEPLKTVVLNGTGSYDPGGHTPLTYRWTTINRPAGSTAFLLNKGTAKPSIWIDVAGTYTIRLEVRNKAGVWDPTPDTMQIVAEPKDHFYAQLTWNSGADLDLHTLRDGMDVFDRGDCAFCAQNPSWYASGRADDPSLDWDVIDGYGPETVTVDTPAPQNYHVKVHYYGVGGNTSCGGPCPGSVATIRFYDQATLLDTMTRTLTDQGQVWDVAVYDGVTGTITHVDTISSTNRSMCQ